jgi:hypothetical protein
MNKDNNYFYIRIQPDNFEPRTTEENKRNILTIKTHKLKTMPTLKGENQ